MKSSKKHKKKHKNTKKDNFFSSNRKNFFKTIIDRITGQETVDGKKKTRSVMSIGFKKTKVRPKLVTNVDLDSQSIYLKNIYRMYFDSNKYILHGLLNLVDINYYLLDKLVKHSKMSLTVEEAKNYKDIQNESEKYFEKASALYEKANKLTLEKALETEEKYRKKEREEEEEEKKDNLK